MAHYAKIENGVVTNVIVAEQDFIDSGTVGDPATWIQTSYNHNVRKRYAGIGYLYLAELDIFVPPKPYPSWTLNEETGSWDPPIPCPQEGKWLWNEDNQNWVVDTHIMPGEL